MMFVFLEYACSFKFVISKQENLMSGSATKKGNSPSCVILAPGHPAPRKQLLVLLLKCPHEPTLSLHPLFLLRKHTGSEKKAPSTQG